MQAAPTEGRPTASWFARTRNFGKRALIAREAFGLCGKRALLAAGAFALMTPRRAFAASSTIGTVSTRGLWLGRLQQVVVRNAPIAVLGFFLSAVLFGGWVLFKVSEAETIGEATFKAYSLLNDIPGADACGEGGLARFLEAALHIVGVFTFAVVLGIVSDGISTKVESVRLSNERVLERKHTVVLNWGAAARVARGGPHAAQAGAEPAAHASDGGPPARVAPARLPPVAAPRAAAPRAPPRVWPPRAWRAARAPHVDGGARW